MLSLVPVHLSGEDEHEDEHVNEIPVLDLLVSDLGMVLTRLSIYYPQISCLVITRF